MLNICIVSSWLPGKRRPNFSPFVYEFAKNLGKSGMNVSVICPLENGEELITQEQFMTIYRVNHKFPTIPVSKLIGKIKPHIIHVHAPNFFSCNVIPVAKLKKIPVIATVHRAEIDKVSNPIFFLRKLALARFEKIVAVSNYTKFLALNAGVDESKITVIHNSCNELFFSRKDKRLARLNCEFPSEKKIVLFVGNLVRVKGIYTLIESLKILSGSIPDLLLIIIGQGIERNKLESIVNKYNLTSNVKFIGWLPQKDLPEYYNAADVFVLPSLTEGHSVALLEAMAVGLPIVASRIGGNIETVREGVNGFLFETGSAEKLAEKLGTILMEEDLRIKMSMQSSKRYLEEFSTKSQINRYLKIYNSAIESR